MITSSNFSLGKPMLCFLTNYEREKIHLSTLEILENTGLEIKHQEALNLLKNAGAIVEENHVRFPENLIKEALHTAPSRVVLADRNGKRSLFLQEKNTYFGTGSCCPFTIDIFTDERRESNKKDVGNMAKISDYLPNIDFVMSMALVKHDHPEIGYPHEFEAMLTNTTKPIILSAADGKNVESIIYMAQIVAESKANNFKHNPFIAIYSESTSPLRHAEDALSKLLVCAKNKIPVIHTVGIMGGATAPATKAGALVQANAELLSALVIHQLKNPGAPFLYGGTITMLDMKTMAHPYGAPEFHQLSSALTEMGEFYNMPVFSTGGCSDAKSFDQQAAAESIYSLLLAALSGGNLIHDVGYIDSGLTSSAEQLIFSDEAIALIKHITQGFNVSNNDLALDIINRVGPGGNFLAEKHTLDNFRNHFMPKLFERKSYNQWQNEGSKVLGSKVKEKAKEIIKNHKPEPIIKDKLEELRKYIEKNEEHHHR